MRFCCLVAAGLVVGAAAVVAQEAGTEYLDPGLRSAYAGEEMRAVKTLSEEDVRQLRNGEGWGLAKAAELNGVPGPAHILSLSDGGHLGLTAEQIQGIRGLYDDVKARARPLGERLIAEERELNERFADGTLSETDLRSLLDQIAGITAELRYVHLSAHLRTPEILTASQIYSYNQMRGYGEAQSVEAPHSPPVHGH